ncbi:MAG: AAA family ATPase [Planctomycetota bacterium]|nr:AAA family ATPase [Planctomycetota bacterium]
MIQDVEIRNFKCFKSLYLPELSRVNIVGGANNVGKTALLEALFMFHDRRSPGIFLKHFHWRGLDLVRSDPEAVWAPYFYDFDLGHPFEIKLKRDGEIETAKYEFNPVFSPMRSNGASSQESEGPVNTREESPLGSVGITYINSDGRKTVAHSYMEDNQAKLEFGSSQPYARSAFLVPARNRPPAEEEAKRLSKVKELKKDKMVEDFLQIIAPGLSDLQVSTAMIKPTIYCDIGLPRLVPVAYAGDGLTRLLSIILDMVNAPGGVVLVDEVENGIHYSVQEKFWIALDKAAKELDCQIIATTHSHESLMAAHSAFATDLFEPQFRYIRLEKIGEEIKAKTYTHEMLGIALEAHLEVR